MAESESRRVLYFQAQVELKSAGRDVLSAGSAVAAARDSGLRRFLSGRPQTGLASDRRPASSEEIPKPAVSLQSAGVLPGQVMSLLIVVAFDEFIVAAFLSCSLL